VLVLLALVADVALVTAFALTGRASHGESPLIGLATTAWPFLAGLAIGWLASRAWRAPIAPLRTGIPVWLITVVGGMFFRVLSGQGVALSFLIVTTIVLGVALIGWRGLSALARRLASRARTRTR